MSQSSSEEKKEQWKELVLKQRDSGLSIQRWCRQNQVVVHNFYYWRDKLFPKTLTRSSFVEIDPTNEGNSSFAKQTKITIEFREIRIHLEHQFDFSILEQCLKALKEMRC